MLRTSSSQGDARSKKWNSIKQKEATKVYRVGCWSTSTFDIQTKQLHVEEAEETVLVVCTRISVIPTKTADYKLACDVPLQTGEIIKSLK